MDDLLALMDDCPPNDDASVTTPDTDHGLFNDAPESTSSSTHTNPNKRRSDNSHAHSHSNSHSTIDPLTKIRIINRQTSKVDLIDIFAPFSFHTTAVLASMSKQSLSSILLPNKNKHDNSISGRTNAATMGIIFKNSGSIFSKKSGRAFTVVTVGDLHTGPTISVMLFGEAYSQFTTKVKAGSVVAFVAMSLLPMKENQGKETRISFSINDADQIVVVGKALDYGVCAGHTVGGGARGEKKRCKNHVDLRISKYCQYHIRQQSQQSQRQQQQRSRQTYTKHGIPSNSTSRKKGNLSAIQAMKIERAETQLLRRQAATNIYRGSSNDRIQNQSQTQHRNSDVMTMDMPSFGGLTPNQTVITHVPNERFLANVPKHMSKSSSPNITYSTKALDKSQRKSSSVFNPYAKNRISSSQLSSSTQHSINSHANNNIPKNKKSLKGGSDVLGQVLNTEKKSHERRKQHEQNSMSKSALPKKRKYVHSYEQGYDGQVYVPKANKLFSRRGTPSSTSSIPRPSAQQNSTPIDKESLIKRQEMIAHRIRFNKSKSENHNPAGTIVSTSNRIIGSTSATDSLDDFLSGGSSSFSQMNQLDKTKVFESKSKYDKEANAESFAKNRNILNQLEKKESSYEKRNGRNGKNDNDKEKNIVMQWVCTTCKRTTGVRPSICYRQNHVVKRKRELKKKRTLAEKRLKSVKNDGLILGAGLEWSGGWKG